MQKGSIAMGKTSLTEERNQYIVPLVSAQEQTDAAALSRYWDARLQGQPVTDTDLDPELRDMVQLLEHYRAVAAIRALHLRAA